MKVKFVTKLGNEYKYLDDIYRNYEKVDSSIETNGDVIYLASELVNKSSKPSGFCFGKKIKSEIFENETRNFCEFTISEFPGIDSILKVDYDNICSILSSNPELTEIFPLSTLLIRLYSDTQLQFIENYFYNCELIENLKNNFENSNYLDIIRNFYSNIMNVAYSYFKGDPYTEIELLSVFVALMYLELVWSGSDVISKIYARKKESINYFQLILHNNRKFSNFCTKENEIYFPIKKEIILNDLLSCEKQDIIEMEGYELTTRKKFIVEKQKISLNSKLEYIYLPISKDIESDRKKEEVTKKESSSNKMNMVNEGKLETIDDGSTKSHLKENVVLEEKEVKASMRYQQTIDESNYDNRLNNNHNKNEIVDTESNSENKLSSEDSFEELKQIRVVLR